MDRKTKMLLGVESLLILVLVSVLAIDFDKTDTMNTDAGTVVMVSAHKPMPLTAADVHASAAHKEEAHPAAAVKKAPAAPPAEAAKAEPAATTEAAKTEAPADAAKTEAPAEAAKTEAPADAAKTEAPADAAKTETPVEAAKTEAPADGAKTEAPADGAKTEAPADGAKTEAPVEAASSGGKTEVADIIAMNNLIYPKHKKTIVSFPHKKHTTEIKIGCGECHHDDGGNPLSGLKMGDAVEGCAACHDKPGKAPKGVKGAEKLKYHANALHANCIKCHKKYNKKNKTKAAPASCNGCHPKAKKK